VSRPERGSATLLGVVLLAVVVLASLVASVVASAIDVRHRAGAAADLAAVAAAEAWVQGKSACSVADTVVRRNRGRLLGCRVDAAAVAVSVEVRRSLLGSRWSVSGQRTAWAGPVTGLR
jgi:secretion/DNA translocation related TadE-like protein